METATEMRHPATRAVAGVRRELASVAEVPLWSLSAGETGNLLGELSRAQAQLEELRARVLVHAETVEVAAVAGATNTGNWLAHRHRIERARAHRQVRVAALLDRRPLTRAALAAGEIHLAQAEVILRAVSELPDELDDEMVDKAERYLLEQAAIFDAKALRVLGRRVLDVIDPAAGEAHEAALLEREEADAAAAARFAMWQDGHGRSHGRFTLPAAQAAMLKKALLALAAPKHRAAAGPLEERRPTPERMGRAFMEYIERYPADRLPAAGGVSATVVVTMTLEALRGGLAAAQLDTGEKVSAGQARRLACEAGLVPVVLGAEGAALDVGRKARLFTQSQRLALAVTYSGCAVEGCDATPSQCHSHHVESWDAGGPTDLANAILVCPSHHRMAHDARYELTRLTGRRIAFHRRT